MRSSVSRDEWVAVVCAAADAVLEASVAEWPEPEDAPSALRDALILLYEALEALDAAPSVPRERLAERSN